MIQSQVKLGWWIAGVVLILDQASKFAILATFDTYGGLPHRLGLAEWNKPQPALFPVRATHAESRDRDGRVR